MTRSARVLLAALAAAIAPAAAVAGAGQSGPWALAVRVESIPGTDPSFNGPTVDGCPFVSRDGKSFYMASDRPGGEGGLDIWVATRKHAGDPWGAPVNLGRPVNSASDDFCPSPANGRLFLFVSTRPGGCGGSDIYLTRLRPRGADEPLNVGCHVNSAADEASPFLLRRGGTVLYFSSTRAGGFAPDPDGAIAGDSDLYASRGAGGGFAPPELVPGVNSAAADARPNLRLDGRELYFDSTRTGTLGGPDIYAATRGSSGEPWSAPANLGPTVNTAFAETRPSLSKDGTTLYFGSNRPGGEGSTDHYVTTRDRLGGDDADDGEED